MTIDMTDLTVHDVDDIILMLNTDTPRKVIGKVMAERRVINRVIDKLMTRGITLTEIRDWYEKTTSTDTQES